ncbi:hypothetical protein ACVC7V_08290 [Hydrogenophaga sp. A37]|uniref:hypothetical protein n=1 Tax=Hydrogenophaga sp. A37 TaxID=1945864 RepID=UPI000984EA7D|nr:hypothetical protein [Hydrogenophaga sp. A37]OOG79252.1 hypothetical protein B0E41_24670 [Hydrogenophaga sp. A37]
MKISLILLALLSGTFFVIEMGNESPGLYVLLMGILVAVVVTAPLGILGGFVLSFFIRSKGFGFGLISFLLACLMLFLPSGWGIEIGPSGVVVFLLFECFLIPSFLAGWGLAGCLRKMGGKIKAKPV